MRNVDLHQGNAVEWARNYKGDLFHALLTDAPYEMNFMGKDWDSSGVAFDPETWRAFASVLYPGAFLIVMAGTINDDLISVAMREAGLRKFHKMAGWVYGSGFPKAQKVKGNTVFSGHRYGLQALKPALEMVLIFQKPYQGRPVDCIVATGAGVLNVDGSRIGTRTENESGWSKTGSKASENRAMSGPNYERPPKDEIGLGRWPANFLLLDAEAARRLDEQSGERPSSKASGKYGTYEQSGINQVYGRGLNSAVPNRAPIGDSGGASRFFFQVREQLDDADPVRYVAKASRRERDAGLDIEYDKRSVWGDGLNSATKIRTKEQQEKGVERGTCRNPHPTVKPLALARYLATLLLPPAEYAPRRIFVPFAGVASECIGAAQAGWEQVVGVELTDEYIPIAQARVEYWRKKEKQLELPDA